MSNVPENLKYTKEHEWVLVDDGVAIVGITDHAQSELGDITFVELPEEESEIGASDEAASVESVKASSPVYSPVSGLIVEVNSDLEETPENLNQDPYDSGWLFKVEMTKPAELDELMSAAEYTEYLAELEGEE